MGELRLFLLSLGLLLGVASGCPPPVPDPTPEPEPLPTVDAGEVGCAEVCNHWRALGCREADPTPNGSPCEEVCVTASQSGFLYWDLACRASVKRCEDIDACER